MTVLADAVEDEIPENVLSNLTNDKPLATPAVDLVKLELGVTRVTAYWRVYAQTAFDELDETHIAQAVRGVQLWLIRRKQETSGADEFQKWLDGINKVQRETTHNDRVTPLSSQGLQPKVPEFQEHQEFEEPLKDLIPRGNIGHRPGSG